VHSSKEITQLALHDFFSPQKAYGIDQRFPAWGTCTPKGTFAYPKRYI